MRYRDNTVKGTRRGSKWPEEVRVACMCDLLIDNNLSHVAQRHGVPESTLRTWEKQARKKSPAEKKSLFEQAREQELRELGRKASAAANESVQQILDRLERNEKDAQIYRWAKMRMNELDGVIEDSVPAEPERGELEPMRYVRPEGPGEREKLQRILERNKPMSDFSASNYLRSLVGVTDRVSRMLGEDQGDKSIEIEIPEDAGELMG